MVTAMARRLVAVSRDESIEVAGGSLGGIDYRECGRSEKGFTGAADVLAVTAALATFVAGSKLDSTGGMWAMCEPK